MTTKAKLQEREEARQRLRADYLKPGDFVHTVLRHVSASGMSRRIDLYKLENGEPHWLSGLASKALGIRQGKDGALVVGGCGMDMGFHVVYELSARLFPDGFGCIGEGCPSNDHSNGDRDYTPNVLGLQTGPDGEKIIGGCGSHWHRDGGYALRHRWL
jgi:hypothetical protein